MESAQQTLRVAGLPSKTEQSDVKHFFTERINRKHGRQIVESVGPICGHGDRITKRTTVSFSSCKTAQKALKLGEPSRRLSAENGGAETITLEASFRDLTTLHSSVNPETTKPDIDIIALHGLTGHAWNSFTTSSSVDEEAGRTKEINWLRDILPRLLEQNRQQHIYPRIMTYGYDADVWMTNSVADITVPVDNLLSSLEIERNEDPERPLFFIGHSLGGIVIKQAIVTLANEALKKGMQQPPNSTKQYNFPVRGCMFFGVPNRGTDYPETASSLLKLLSRVFNVNRNVVRDLESKSQRLAKIASKFGQIREERNIPIISFFETVKYNNFFGLIVDKASAVIEYPDSPRPFGINRNHREMAKFSDGDTHALEPAINFLAQFARDAINARQLGHLSVSGDAPSMIINSNVEDKFSILDSYDTVFLVDDSPSMAGERWELVKKILNRSTTVAMCYDPDGVDMHFFNNKNANQDNIKDPVIAEEIHQNIELRGNTPLLHQLSEHLDCYRRIFETRNADEINFKGYNLIILTDGKSDEEFEDPDEVSDREDAKVNSAAYRLIRKEIVKMARAFDKAQAGRTQVGIQFCQIGNDEGAHAFFRYLDNNLKGRYKLGRDASALNMVDTIHCSTEADLTEEFLHKLLVGAIDKKTDHVELSEDSSEGEGNRQLVGGQRHSDPQTTKQNFHDPQTSIRPQLGPNGEQQQHTWYTQQDQPQSIHDDQDHWTPGQLPRDSTLPQTPS
ncbi:hypothetical protein MMC29_001791 [Sticta canariensis]|nr:hypothetical protein [Sticta canariensis]